MNLKRRLSKLEGLGSGILVVAVVPIEWDEHRSSNAVKALVDDQAPPDADYLIIPQQAPPIEEAKLLWLGDGDELFRQIAEEGRRVCDHPRITDKNEG